MSAFKPIVPISSDDSQIHAQEAMWRAIPVLFLGLFVAASLSTPDPPLPGMAKMSHALSVIPTEASASLLVDPSSFSQTAARDTGSSTSLVHAGHPLSEMRPGREAMNALPERRQLVSRIDRPATATLTIVGDVMLGRQVGIEMAERDDYSWPFLQTSDLLMDADLTLGNLETPLVSGCPLSSEGMVFCAVPRSAEGLAWAGIDGVSLANNHAYTYSELGFEQTVDYLQRAGIEPIPAGVMAMREVNGIRIGILSFDDSSVLLDIDQAAAAVSEASHQVDVLIGLLHWGIEYQAEPNQRQREVAHALVDAGMDVIVGAHPHLIQPVEEYHGKLIIYSLGNFVFDQMWWEETRLGEVVRLILVETLDGVAVSYAMTQIEIYDYGQPAIVGQGH